MGSTDFGRGYGGDFERIGVVVNKLECRTATAAARNAELRNKILQKSTFLAAAVAVLYSDLFILKKPTS